MQLSPQMMQMFQQAFGSQMPPSPMPSPQLPMPFEGGFGGWNKPIPPQLHPFGMFGGSNKGAVGQPVQPGLPFGAMMSGMNPQFSQALQMHPQLQYLQQMFQGMGNGLGNNSGGIGARGPNPSPFLGLNKFSGPFGNGGGAMQPGFGSLARPF